MAGKKIVYLFGSGATHAVINSIDPTKQLLTADIRQKIREKEHQIKNIEIKTELWNELMDPAVDIEHLISILESNYNYSSTQAIRKFYHDAIVELSKEIIIKINDSAYIPNLYSVLFDLHEVKDLDETLIGIFTLNYEDLLEQTLKSHLNFGVDYSLVKKRRQSKNKTIPVLKLHGSFNWKNTRPIIVDDYNRISGAEALWIPPGVDKKKENYPFNILWGKAFEFLMECNLLRVIGCSLRRNDWGLIPMIYTAMRLTGNNPNFEIEIIDFFDKGKKIKEDYPYLSMKTIVEVKEFYNYLIDVYSLSPSLAIPQYIKDDISSEASKKINVFEWWLKSKRFELQNAGKDITTKKQYLSNFS